MIDLEELAKHVGSDVAALMVTNPNTLGVFEENIVRAAGFCTQKAPWFTWTAPT